MSFSGLAQGTVIGGRYRLARPLAQGGMGTVWVADHVALSSKVAVKIIDEAAAASDELRARFLREAQAAASLRSPHVVQIIDYGVHEDAVPYIVMELLEGKTLADALSEGGGSLAAPRVARIMTQVARAVSKAHERGIVHRDLKPDNVFLVQNDDEEIAKVLDFGIAKVRGSEIAGTNTRTGTLLGTPFYMSPEQARGNAAVDERTDLWSMAVITFQCLTGGLPFASEGFGDLVIQICTDPIPVPSTRANVPPGFDAWFAKAASRAAADRFPSAREQNDALRRVLVPAEGRASVADIDETLDAPTRLFSPAARESGAIGAPPPPPPEPSRAAPTLIESVPSTLASPGGDEPVPSTEPDPEPKVRVVAKTPTPLAQPSPALGSTTRAVVSEPRPGAERSRGVLVTGAAMALAAAIGVAWLAFGPRSAARPDPSPGIPTAPASVPQSAPTGEPTPAPHASSAEPPPPPPPAAASSARAASSSGDPGARSAPKKPTTGPKAKTKDDLGI